MNGDDTNPEIAFTLFFIFLMFSIILCRDSGMDRGWNFEDLFQSA